MHAEVQPNSGRQNSGHSINATDTRGLQAGTARGVARIFRPLTRTLAGLFVLGSLAAFQSATAQEIKGDAEAAKGKISMCTGCHAIAGYRASFPTVYRVPYIGGQSEAYLVSALVAYRKGDRSPPTMRGIAGSLSDQDIADLAAFYAQAN